MVQILSVVQEIKLLVVVLLWRLFWIHMWIKFRTCWPWRKLWWSIPDVRQDMKRNGEKQWNVSMKACCKRVVDVSLESRKNGWEIKSCNMWIRSMQFHHLLHQHILLFLNFKQKQRALEKESMLTRRQHFTDAAFNMIGTGPVMRWVFICGIATAPLCGKDEWWIRNCFMKSKPLFLGVWTQKRKTAINQLNAIPSFIPSITAKSHHFTAHFE